MREIENPMVLDSLWDALDQVDEEQEDELEDWYRKCDEEYDEDVANRLSFYE